MWDWKAHHIGPCSEGAATTTPTVQLEWTWLSRGQLYGALKKFPYPPSPPTAGWEDEMRQWMDAFSDFEGLHYHLASLASRWQFFCVELHLKLCLSLECWCSSPIAHVHVTQPSTEFLPSFSSLSLISGCFQLSSLTWTLFQNLLIFKQDILK